CPRDAREIAAPRRRHRDGGCRSVPTALIRPDYVCSSNRGKKAVKEFSLGLAFVAIALSQPLTLDAAAPAALKTFLEHEGFGGSSLQRRFGNHLFANTIINGRRTALMIDSGCPITLIDRTSAQKLGLQVQETRKYIGGVTGHAERYGISKLSTLAMGNCTFANVPVEVANESQINLIARPHLDGL